MLGNTTRHGNVAVGLYSTASTAINIIPIISFLNFTSSDTDILKWPKLKI